MFGTIFRLQKCDADIYLCGFIGDCTGMQYMLAACINSISSYHYAVSAYAH